MVISQFMLHSQFIIHITIIKAAQQFIPILMLFHNQFYKECLKFKIKINTIKFLTVLNISILTVNLKKYG
jgi:hypothetical protein